MFYHLIWEFEIGLIILYRQNIKYMQTFNFINKSTTI